MLYLVIVLLEIFLLLLFSKILPTLLTQVFYFFIRNQKVSVILLAIIFFPGTLIHELAHLLSAGMMLVSVGGINLIPKIEEHGVKLGHVEIAKTDPIRRSIIGFAPVLAGIAVIFGVIFWANSLYENFWNYPVWLFLTVSYVVSVIGNTMFSSRKDLEGTLGVSIVFIALLITIYLLGFENIFVFLKLRLIDSHPLFYQNLAYFLGLPVVLNIFIYLFAKLLVKRMY